MESDAPATELLSAAWRDQAVWSATAGELKAGLTTWRTRAAVAGVAGALLQTTAATLPDIDELRVLRVAVALLGVALLATVPYILGTMVTRDRIAEWVRARSTSEAIKEQIYRFLVGVPPHDSDRSGRSLRATVQAEKERVRDLNRYAAGVDPPQKTRPLAMTIDDYVEGRVDDQITRYYKPRARDYSRAAQRLRRIEFGLGLFATVLGAIATAAVAAGAPGLAGIGAWVAVVTGAGAAMTAHIAASGYDRQSITFYATAEHLSSLRDDWRGDPDRKAPERIAKFVDACESAISSENEAWLGAWTKAGDQPAAA